MKPVKNINGEQIKDLITKFFYKDNHLCFQILLHMRTNETIAYGMYSDYADYKKDFNNLKDARSNNLTIIIQNKNKEINVDTSKMA